MSEKFVTLAAFPRSAEAELARGRLEAEGIKAFLMGGGSVDVFGGIQGLGGISLQVSEVDAMRATAILAAVEAERERQDGDPESDDAVLWLCPLCGDAVRDDLSVCPSCETPRPAPEKSQAVTAASRRPAASQDVQEDPVPKPDKVTSDTPLEAVPSAVEDDLEVPDMETLVGDDLVRRAFFSALFPILIPYSFWLLAQLGSYEGKISPRMMPRLYLAIAIDAIWFFLSLLLLIGCLGLLPRF